MATAWSSTTTCSAGDELLPRSVAVFGAGVVWLELGQALSRLGVRVRVYGRNAGLAGISDPEIRTVALDVFRHELAVDTEAKVLSVTREGDDVRVRHVGEDGAEKEESFQYALVAAGRKPNLRRLALHAAGIPLSHSKVPIYDPLTLQCGEAPVFIAGDANGDVPLLHEAADEGRIAGENAVRFPNVAAGLRRSRLSIVFTDPQIASVGTPFPELPRDPGFATGEVSFKDQGRSQGDVRTVAAPCMSTRERSGTGRPPRRRQLVGPRAEHPGHLLARAHQ